MQEPHWNGPDISLYLFRLDFMVLKDQTVLALTAMILIAILETVWVLTGHNSISMGLAVSAILTLAGYKIGFQRALAKMTR